MEKSDFNRELDRYLSRRKKGVSGSGLSFSMKRDEEAKKPAMKVERMEEYDDELVQDEPKKESGGRKLFGFFRISDKKQEEEVEEVPEPVLGEDVKEVLKASYKWILQLPPHKIKEFKASPDFQKYTDVLVKYGLAKKTDKK